MKNSGCILQVVKLFTTPNALRKIADEMDKKTPEIKWGGQNLIRVIPLDKSSCLEIRFNQDYFDGKKFTDL
jgi:hypothetical protein